MDSDRAIRCFSPPSTGWLRSAWSGGAIDSGQRRFASEVEGNICIPHHLLLVTLKGGAKHLQVQMECGHRFDGMDRAGQASFIPAGCRRSVQLRDVESEWASISLDPKRFEGSDWAPFTNRPDRLIAELAGEMAGLQRLEGAVDPLLLESVSMIIAHRLSGYASRPIEPDRITALPARQLRRINEFIDANLAAQMSVADLAAIASMSPSHFHRCFRRTTGETPLAFITRRRIDAAIRIISDRRISMYELALSVGFASTGHFARCFQHQVGASPSRFARNLWQDRAI